MSSKQSSKKFSNNPHNPIDHDDGSILRVEQYVRLMADIAGENKSFRAGALAQVVSVDPAPATPPNDTKVFPETALYKLKAIDLVERTVVDMPIRQGLCPHAKLSYKDGDKTSEAVYENGDRVILKEKFEYSLKGNTETVAKGSSVEIEGPALSASGRTITKNVKDAHYCIRRCRVEKIPRDGAITRGRYQRAVFHPTLPKGGK